MSTFVIARLTFHEAARRRILLAALLLGVLFLMVFGVGLSFIVEEINDSSGGPSVLQQNEIFGFLLMAGLYVVNFLTIMMTVLTSVDTLSGEITTGTVHTLMTKPVRRWEIVLGKWLGFAGMLGAYLLLMAGGVMLIVYGFTDYVAPNAIRGLSLMLINILLLLSVSLLGGSILSTLANGVLVFGLYGVAFVGGWIEHIGSFVQNETALDIGIMASLLLPSEALWRRAVHEMQSPLVAALGVSPFSSSSVPSPFMVGYAILYATIMLMLAMRAFSQRDL
ncbi:MAG: ABC transporter permease [Ardenticatenaceae bacterium]